MQNHSKGDTQAVEREIEGIEMGPEKDRFDAPSVRASAAELGELQSAA